MTPRMLRYLISAPGHKQYAITSDMNDDDFSNMIENAIINSNIVSSPFNTLNLADDGTESYRVNRRFLEARIDLHHSGNFHVGSIWIPRLLLWEDPANGDWVQYSYIAVCDSKRIMKYIFKRISDCIVDYERNRLQAPFEVSLPEITRLTVIAKNTIKNEIYSIRKTPDGGFETKTVNFNQLKI